MRAINLAIFIFIISSCFGQKAKHVFNGRTIIHAIDGLTLYANPNLDSAAVTQYSYGDTLIVLSKTSVKTIQNGYHGEWIKVMRKDTIGYVQNPYLSNLPSFEMNEKYNYLKDYFYSAFTKIEGEDFFNVTDATRRREAKFDKGNYRLKGESCDLYEEFNFSKRYSVQEIFIVLLPFNWNFHEIKMDHKNYEKDEEGRYYTNYYQPTEFLSLDYHLTYSKDENGEFNYLSAYFDCEAGGGHLMVEETERTIKVIHEYGCH